MSEFAKKRSRLEFVVPLAPAGPPTIASMTAEINRLTDEISRRKKEAAKEANDRLRVEISDPTAEFIFDRDRKVRIKTQSLSVRVFNDNAGGVFVQEDGSLIPFVQTIDRTDPFTFVDQVGDSLLTRIVKKWEKIITIHREYLVETH